MLCKSCGNQFYSDCADICKKCFIAGIRKEAKEKELEARARAIDRIKGFPLKIELVPETSWYDNLRNRVSREEWDKIRYETYREAGNKCSVCGRGNAVMYCHEVWAYDDDKHIQTLKGFEALCVLCNRVHHIGLAGIQLSKEDYNAVIRHYRRVNKCSYQDFLIARDVAFEVWEERSMVEWYIELGEYGELCSNQLS